MKILITTPLYPPEIADIAVYSKNLALRLSKNHNITLLTYANHPIEVKGFSLCFAPKDKYFIGRIFSYLKILQKIIEKQDVVLIHSGISAAIPALIVSKLRSKKVIFRYFEDEPEKRRKIRTHKTKIRIIDILQNIILKFSDIIVYSSSKLGNKLENKYHIQKDKIVLIEDPQDQKIILPFSQDEISNKILSLPYIQNILKKGNEEGKISWEEHIEKLEEQL